MVIIHKPFRLVKDCQFRSTKYNALLRRALLGVITLIECKECLPKLADKRAHRLLRCAEIPHNPNQEPQVLHTDVLYFHQGSLGGDSRSFSAHQCHELWGARTDQHEALGPRGCIVGNGTVQGIVAFTIRKS